MSSRARRFEVLLPVRFNDGRDIPEELLGEAVNELVEQFGAPSFYKQIAEELRPLFPLRQSSSRRAPRARDQNRAGYRTGVARRELVLWPLS